MLEGACERTKIKLNKCKAAVAIIHTSGIQNLITMNRTLIDKQQVLEIKFNYHVIFIIGLHYHLGTSLQMLKAMMSNWRYMCFMSPSEREELQI